MLQVVGCAVSTEIADALAEKLLGFGWVAASGYGLKVDHSSRNSACLSSREMTVFRDAGDSRSLPGVFFRCRASGKHWIKDA